MVTSRMDPSSSVTRARAALVNVDELLFGLLLVGVSGSAGGADGLISAGIVCRLAQLRGNSLLDALKVGVVRCRRETSKE